ncbi:universal stress protein [Actinomycetospora straminea]|uniref:UspA domain-containing protein n=1 Tax=Actinomycetospora straminea TaxID=663607 RepID=A0ABP9DR94_9PSEU|nr:universal stress protein [Actinomycetospora straminea]MDD7936279.1 universal stress protein [Actinomycetospora straminea]
MTVLVGHLPGTDPDGRALVLGGRLARALGGPLVLCTVTGPGEDAAPAVPEAPAIEGVEVEVTSIADRSVPGGLARAAHAHQAAVVVLGDAPPGPGSIGARLARAADVPVALGRDGALHEGPITRVTCAWGGGRHAERVLATAVDLARRTGATVRVASFGPQRGRTVPPEAGLHAEQIVVEQWREQMEGAQRAALAQLGVTDAETLAAADATVEEAVTGIGWDPGELLVVGANAVGTATRVLLGDPGAAVLRAAPVPVVLTPGTTTLS